MWIRFQWEWDTEEVGRKNDKKNEKKKEIRNVQYIKSQVVLNIYYVLPKKGARDTNRNMIFISLDIH